MEMEEMVRMVIFIIILVILVSAVGVLLTGKGGDILGAIKDLLRFGR